MLIDWFTVVAQALNFLILIWLMKRFLYKPIIRAIEARETRIAAELADAENKKLVAQKESDEFKLKNEEFDQQRAVLWSKVTDQANTERQRLFDEAGKNAAILGLKRFELLKNEEHNLLKEIRFRAQREVFAISRKTLADLASTRLEEQLCEVFIRRLRDLQDQAKTDLLEAIKTATEPAIVRSAFELSAEQQAKIQAILKEDFQTKISIRFETEPNLISGVELTVNGQKVSWSIANYLASLENGVDELLKDKVKSDEKAEPAPETLQPETRSN